MRKTALCLPLIMLGVAVLLASSPPKVAAVPYSVAGLPFRMESEGVSGTRSMKASADGKTLGFQQTIKVRLDSAGPERSVVTTARHQPVASGGRLSLSVADTTAGSTSVYGFDPSTSTLTVQTGSDSVAVVKNPNGSYLVDGATAANGKAAVALLKKSKAYTKASPYGLLVAYASAQGPMPEVRGGVECFGNSGTMGASTPAVCTVLQDLCDCAACDASGKWGNCEKCR